MTKNRQAPGQKKTTISECLICNELYDKNSRRGQPGLITHCEDCAVENVVRYTGNMIYTHKTGGSIQINADPNLTNYINASTKKHTYGANISKGCGTKTVPKSQGACISVSKSNTNAKGKQ